MPNLSNFRRNLPKEAYICSTFQQEMQFIFAKTDLLYLQHVSIYVMGTCLNFVNVFVKIQLRTIKNRRIFFL